MHATMVTKTSNVGGALALLFCIGNVILHNRRTVFKKKYCSVGEIFTFMTKSTMCIHVTMESILRPNQQCVFM